MELKMLKENEVLVSAENKKTLSKIELLKLLSDGRTHHYGDEPTGEENVRAGSSVWIRFRDRAAEILCSERAKGGSKITNAVVEAGLANFVTATFTTFVKAGLFISVTSAMAGALLVLLYKELVDGLDMFCEVHWDG